MRIDSLHEAWEREKRELDLRGLWRDPLALTPELFHGLVDFSSNDSLGMRKLNRPQNCTEGSLQFGVSNVPAGAGASRFVRDVDPDLRKLEAEVAEWTGWPAAVYFSSGFVANCALAEALAPSSDFSPEFFIDVRAHASVHAAARFSGAPVTFFPHGNYASLRRRLARSTTPVKIIFVESLHSMDGTFENALELAQACRDYNAWLVVDEAHTTGLLGPSGAGWVAALPELRPYVLSVMHGCGKALGAAGGFVVGTIPFQQRLFQRSKHCIFSTAPSPLVTRALRQAVSLARSSIGDAQRKKLARNTAVFADRLTPETLAYFPGLGQTSIFPSPVFACIVGSAADATRLSQRCFQDGLLVRAIRPPTVPRGTSRLRIAVRADHTAEEIGRLADVLAGCLRP